MTRSPATNRAAAISVRNIKQRMAKRLRDDENFADVFAWEYQGDGGAAEPKLHREPLVFESVHLATRSYK